MPRLSDRQRVLQNLEENAEALLLLDLFEDGEHDELFDLNMIMYAQVLQSRSLSRPTIYNMRRGMRAVRMEGMLGCDDRHFRQEARMSEQCSAKVVSLIEHDEVFQNRSTKEQDPVQYQLLVTLFRLGKHGNGSIVAHISSYFVLGDGTVNKYTSGCLAAIYELRARYLRWPNAEERLEIAARIAHDHHFGSCGGMIDGSLVFMEQRPGVSYAANYYCRKHRYAFNILGVCGDTKRIRALVTGWAGSVNDQRIFDYTSVSHHPSHSSDSPCQSSPVVCDIHANLTGKPAVGGAVYAGRC